MGRRIKNTFMDYTKNNNDNALVSNQVSCHIAQQGEAYPIPKKLIKPCVKYVVTTIIREKQA